MNKILQTKPLEIGALHPHKMRNGFRVIGNDTSSGRPWMWYFPTLESATEFAKVLLSSWEEEVDICKYVGSVRPVQRPVEFVSATDLETSPTPDNGK